MVRTMLIVIANLLIASVAVAQTTSTRSPSLLRAKEYPLTGESGGSVDPRRVQKLVNSWKDTKDAGEREKLEKSLRDALKQEFESRLESHEREIKELEEKVRQLRDRLALRKEKQSEIVDHRLEQILRDAQGLGWGTDAANSSDASYFVREVPGTPYVDVVPAPAKSVPFRSTLIAEPVNPYGTPDTPKGK